MQFLFLSPIMKIDEFRNRMLTDMKHTTPKVYIKFFNFTYSPTNRPWNIPQASCMLTQCLPQRIRPQDDTYCIWLSCMKNNKAMAT